jgi:hypothetical protein
VFYRDKPPLSSSQRDKTTPVRSSTSSISKDSLHASSPDPHQDSTAPPPPTEAVPVNPALSFTIDFGSETSSEKRKKLKSGASLSEFVPTKLRNSLHARGSSSEKSLNSSFSQAAAGSGSASGRSSGKNSVSETFHRV